MPAPRLVARCALALLALPLVLAAGCGKKNSVLRPNLPPETTVFVQFTPGPGHDVNHLIHLYWFGTDPDGDVVGYDFRFIPAGALPDTVPWIHTTLADSIFAVYTPTGYSTPTFEVRAVDNSGLVDPIPAFQTFNFTNQPPVLNLVHRRLIDTTFASVTLSWSATDPDGDTGKMRFRVWLDGTGNAANPFVTAAKIFTVPTSAFLESNGHLASRYRTAYVQPIDDGGMLGLVDSTVWYVRSPVPGGDRGRLLLVDDVTGRIANPYIYDTLYVNTAARNLAANAYSILRLTFSQPFQSAKDVEQTFKLFDAVIWYRGPQTGLATIVQSNQDGIAAYLDAGGRFMFESTNAIEGRNALGALRSDFVTRYLGSDGLHLAPIQGQPDSTISWGINGGMFIQAPPFQEIVGDTAIKMVSTIILGGLRGFVVRDTQDVVLWARAGNLSPANPYDIPIAVSVPRSRAQPQGGRFILTTYPLRSASHPRYPGISRFLAKLFKQMGLAQ